MSQAKCPAPQLCYNRCFAYPWRYRLGVRTEDSQSSNPGSIPGSATKSFLLLRTTTCTSLNFSLRPRNIVITWWGTVAASRGHNLRHRAAHRKPISDGPANCPVSSRRSFAYIPIPAEKIRVQCTVRAVLRSQQTLPAVRRASSPAAFVSCVKNFGGDAKSARLSLDASHFPRFSALRAGRRRYETLAVGPWVLPRPAT